MTMAHSRPNQAQKILDYMRKHGGITQMEAVEKFRCYRLSARIFELKEQGHNIISDRVQFKNEDGETDHFVRYTLVEGSGTPCQ